MSIYQSGPPEAATLGATQSGTDADLRADITTTAVADPLRRAVLRLITLQQEMAYLANDLSEVETVLSIQDATVLSANTLTLEAVRQQLANALRPLGEAHAEDTASHSAKNQGPWFAEEYGVAGKTGSHFEGHVGDVRVTLTVEIDRFDTESGRRVRQHRVANSDGVAGVSGLWQQGL
jgi:hypothetical protein